MLPQPQTNTVVRKEAYDFLFNNKESTNNKLLTFVLIKKP